MIGMKANDYQRLARRTQNKNLNLEQKMMHALHGMASEVGEIHSIYQHRLQHGGEIQDYESLRGEVGDLLWFIAEFCDAMGWHMEDMMNRNIEKLRRRYPEGFDEERSKHRHELEVSEEVAEE